MTVFVDTSAFYAGIDRDDESHASARETWLRLLREGHVLLTTIAFQSMRENAVRTAFCFDRHYAEQGFTVHPLIPVDGITRLPRNFGIRHSRDLCDLGLDNGKSELPVSLIQHHS